MFGLGFSEILFLGVLALIVIGPEDLPRLARTMGRFLNDIKRSANGMSDEFRSQIKIDLEDSTRNHRQQANKTVNPPASESEPKPHE